MNTRNYFINAKEADIRKFVRMNRCIRPDEADVLFVSSKEKRNIETFYQYIEDAMVTLIRDARTMMRLWNSSYLNEQLVCLDGGCMYLLNVLVGVHPEGAIIPLETVERELESITRCTMSARELLSQSEFIPVPEMWSY